MNCLTDARVRAAWLIALLALPAAHAAGAEASYLGPVDVVASPDGKLLYVLLADANQVAVVDAASQQVTRTIACPARPNGLAISPDGARIYAACGDDKGVVCAIDAASGQIAATIPVGHTPSGLAALPDGKRLFVCNRFHHDLSVIDLEAGQETARVKAIREPTSAAATPDGQLVLVTNLLPVDASDSYDVAAEVTLIETGTLKTQAIRLPNGSSSVREVCVSPDGKFAYVAHVLSRYQMPTTQLERGWMNTNALSVLDVAQRKLLNTVLLDDIDLGAANPWAVATTADGKTVLVSHAGTHELTAIDAGGLIAKLQGMPATIDAAKAAGRYDTQGTYSSITVEDVPNDLAFLVDLKRRIQLRRGGPWGLLKDEGPLINGPRGLAVIGNQVYVAVYFSDKLAVVDLEDKSYYPVKPIALGPDPELSVVRRGQMYFHDADFCFQHWQSCASCHPDIRVDGLNWDLMNDGLGTPKNTRSMLLAHRTPPSMSQGARESAEEAVRAGIRHIQFAVRPEEDAVAIDEFLKTLQAVPSPQRVEGKLSEAAERGKSLFFAESVGCAKCHPEPLYTDLKSHNVNSRGKYDNSNEFDTPTLVECWRTAPYMHDGHWTTLQPLMNEGKHGAPKDRSLTEQEMNDLIEFVLSL